MKIQRKSFILYAYTPVLSYPILSYHIILLLLPLPLLLLLLLPLWPLALATALLASCQRCSLLLFPPSQLLAQLRVGF